jgi:hypothetical protein
MTGIGVGPIGENGIGGVTHVSSSISDSYQIERVNLPAVLEDSYGIAISATVSDSYLVRIASMIGSAYSIALEAILQVTYQIQTLNRIDEAYKIQVAARLSDRYWYLLPSGSVPTGSSISGSYEICQGVLPYTMNYSEEYRFRQDFTLLIPWSDSTKYNWVFGGTDSTPGQYLTIYRCDGVNTSHELYLGKNCRSDFGDLYFYQVFYQIRMPHKLRNLRWDPTKQAEAVDVSIVMPNSRLYSTLSVRLYYGLDRVDPSPAWPPSTWPTPPGFMVVDWNCSSWYGWTSKYLHFTPTGSYNISVGRPAVDSYRIHLAKIMEG